MSRSVFRWLVVCLVGACFVGAGGCRPPQGDPLAEDVARLAGPVLHVLRAGGPQPVPAGAEDMAASLRSRARAIRAVAEPDPWVAACATDAAAIYDELADAIDAGEPAAAPTARVLLGGAPSGDDGEAGDDAALRALEGARERFRAGADRAAPERESSVALGVGFALAGPPHGGGVLTIRNASGGPLDGVVAQVRFIDRDGAASVLAAHAERWPGGEDRVLRVLPVHGTPALRGIGPPDLVEVRLVGPGLRSRPVRAVRPPGGWPGVVP